MVDLSTTFTHCQHCDNRTMEPRNVCPSCDWPRQHTELTPAPIFGCADPNAQFVPARLETFHQHLAEVKLVPPAPPAPAMVESELPDLGVVEAPARTSLAKLRTLTLAPDDPVADAE